MKDDVRYAEFLFLRMLAQNRLEYFVPHDQRLQTALGLNHGMCIEMALTLIEDSYARIDGELQLLVGRLRREIYRTEAPSRTAQVDWDNPREALARALSSQFVQRVRITYRGLRRIEELRDLLKRDRILEDFGVLLSVRYFRKDLDEALQRPSDMPVSVLYFDMDNFGRINKEYGQAAGDVVMKAYLEAVLECIGDLGSGYRGVGDEVVGLVPGIGHEKAMQVAEAIRLRVEGMHCEYKEKPLPKVTVSSGVATTPPQARSLDIETLAESRKRLAKEGGKNRIVGT